MKHGGAAHEPLTIVVHSHSDGTSSIRNLRIPHDDVHPVSLKDFGILLMTVRHISLKHPQYHHHNLAVVAMMMSS